MKPPNTYNHKTPNIYKIYSDVIAALERVSGYIYYLKPISRESII